MLRDEWNRQDELALYLYSPVNPLERGPEGLDAVLDFIESLDERVRPDRFFRKRSRKYSRGLVHEKLPECRVGRGEGAGVDLTFHRSRSPDVDLWLLFFDRPSRDRDTRFVFRMTLSPFAWIRETGQTEEHARLLCSLVRAFAQRFPISYGLAHSFTDYLLNSDSHPPGFEPPTRAHDAYWLNVYGPRMVQEHGREHVLSTPSVHREELPGGAVLWLTRPTPADFDSEESRLAQARALVHLRPELNLDETLATLRQRSLVFTPLPVQFDEDVADILRWEVEAKGLPRQRELVERFNAYHPPPVSEWLPASEAPVPDVDDVQAHIAAYEGRLTEKLIALLRKDVPALMEGSPEAIPRVDYHLWHSGWGRLLPDVEKELLAPALGAWLGMHLVHTLGGRWVPRRNWVESAVVLGDRAWLPFLRARHALKDGEAPLDFSCSQLFRLAQRLVPGRGPPRA